MKNFTAGKNDAGQRLDKFLRKAAPNLPPALLYKAIRKKDIKLNKKRASPGEKLCENDIISVYLPDDILTGRTHPNLEKPSELDIIYEDVNILLINKPQGLLCHPGEGGDPDDDTLVLRLWRYLHQSGGWSGQDENSFTPALCNRIDRNTCGIVIAAKNLKALQIVSEKLRERQITKLYLCIVHGIPAAESGTLHAYLSKDETKGLVSLHKQPQPGGKTAVTKYKVIARLGGKALVEAELITGRTHQIRAQLAGMGHPILGDAKYGNSRENKLYGNKQVLCAYKLAFSFTTPAGSLDYLGGKTFEITPPFSREFLP